MVWNGMEPWVLFKRSSRQSIGYLISSNNSHPSNNRLPQTPPPPHPNPSSHFLFLLSRPCYYSAIIPENMVLYESPGIFFQLHAHSKNIVFFSVPTAVSKLLYFITLQCTSWLNHLLSSWHKYCTSTYCLKYNFFRVLHNLAKCPLPKVMLYVIFL